MLNLFRKTVLINVFTLLSFIYLALMIVPPILLMPSVQKLFVNKSKRIDRNLSNPELVQARKLEAQNNNVLFDDRSVLKYYNDVKDSNPNISIFVTNATINQAKKIDSTIANNIWGLSSASSLRC